MVKKKKNLKLIILISISQLRILYRPNLNLDINITF